MSIEWIKIRKDLHDDPAVISIARQLSIDEHSVVGRLAKLWGWADSHTTNGSAAGVTAAWIDRHCGAQGFAEAMEKSGWLVIDQSGISFPKFSRHNGQSAKQRALTANRNRNLRRRSRDGDSVTRASPEKKRKEKKTTEKKTKKNTYPPSSEAGEFWGESSNQKSKNKRSSDPLWETLARVTGTDPAVSRTHLAKVYRLLQGADPPYLAADVEKLAEVIKTKRWNDGHLTLGMVEKWIGLVRADPAATENEFERTFRELFGDRKE